MLFMPFFGLLLLLGSINFQFNFANFINFPLMIFSPSACIDGELIEWLCIEYYVFRMVQCAYDELYSAISLLFYS